LEEVALVNEELLSLVCIVHFFSVGRDQTVEKSIEIFLVVRCLLLSAFLGSKDSSQALGFLPATAEVRRDLDDYIGHRQVDGGVTYRRQENTVHVIGLLEVLKNVKTFLLRDHTLNIGTHEFSSQFFEREQIV